MASLVHQKDLSGLMNEEKSVLEFVQVGKWLGSLLSSSQENHKLKSNLDPMILSLTTTFRDLARVAGFINSLYLAVGAVVGLFTRQIR